MSGSLWLNWASLSVSIFNTLILVWLGLTVLLNAQRRTWGVWLAGEGLLMGAAFFVSHTVLLSQNLTYTLNPGLDFWWRAGWWPVVLSPFAWYVLMLWYSGFWEGRGSALYRRQLAWFAFSVLLTLFQLGLLAFANPLPSLGQVARLDLSTAPALGGMPLLFLGFLLDILLCISLSLDALLRPAPTPRLMGAEARRRARPWLAAATLALLAVALLVSGLLFWLVNVAGRAPLTWDTLLQLADELTWADLALAGLLTAAILLLGQALVVYEVFTGSSLPRRGFRRQWRAGVLWTGALSLLMGAGLIWQVRPVYSLLAVLLMMVAFVTLNDVRARREREESIHRLRPFAAGPRLYERLLTPGDAPLSAEQLGAPFAALCRDVLNVERAALIPLGPMAALAGDALFYPADAPQNALPPIDALAAQFTSPRGVGLPLDAAHSAGMLWAAPLWGERGLIGLLLLGPKSDGGLFSQEEIEVARASGERLVDLLAGAEIARRLMVLQRQRLAQSQVLDRRARRVLHDDVLPLLHTALLSLSARPAEDETVDLLSQVHRRISQLLREIPPAAAPELARLGLLAALRQVTDLELKDAFDQVTWQVDPLAEAALAALPALPAEVIFYAAREAMRNAALHARPPRPNAALSLCVRAEMLPGLRLTIQDDGVGLAGGVTTGSGQGLALHSTLMAVIGGSLALESAPGAYTRVILSLPEQE